MVRLIEPTDAILRLAATCICGSDLWPYRGIAATKEPTPIGHEYCGIIEEVGSAVTSVKRGQFVIGSFFASDNTCPHCRAGYQTSCQHRQPVVGAQAPVVRVPLADGTLVATREVPSTNLVPSMLAASDVLGTGWFAADAANVKPGKTVVVVGDGAVGLLAVLSAKRMTSPCGGCEGWPWSHSRCRLRAELLASTCRPRRSGATPPRRRRR
jgi:threonine dehydrogenase-like Zn-dependent dehydrogenase